MKQERKYRELVNYPKYCIDGNGFLYKRRLTGIYPVGIRKPQAGTTYYYILLVKNQYHMIFLTDLIKDGELTKARKITSKGVKKKIT